MVNLRADGGGPVSIVDADTGSLLGTMDSPQTHYQAHTGAIYVHQGDSYVVEDLNEDDHCVVVRRANPDYYTTARDVTQIEVLETQRTTAVGRRRRALRRRESDNTGGLLPAQGIDLERDPRRGTAGTGRQGPVHQGGLVRRWTTGSLTGAGLIEAQFPGALHAAEHAAIGLLPLVASSDRWDIGGVSTAIHADTGVPTIFVYDGHPGGAGFAERGYDKARVVADRHPRRDQGLRMRVRLPVLRAVAQVRQQEQPPRQGRRRHPDRRAAQGRHRKDGCRPARGPAAGAGRADGRPCGSPGHRSPVLNRLPGSSAPACGPADRPLREWAGGRVLGRAGPGLSGRRPEQGPRAELGTDEYRAACAFRTAQHPCAVPACDCFGDGARLAGGDSPGGIRSRQRGKVSGSRGPVRGHGGLRQEYDHGRRHDDYQSKRHGQDSTRTEF